MKKRVFAILIAVVMIATAINVAPVLEVYATGGDKMNNQYSLYDGDGRWDAGQYYYNDGDYSSTVADYHDADHSNGVNKEDENFKTRHVTMFNNCDKQTISYTGSGSSLRTNRNQAFSFTDRSDALKTYYKNVKKELEASNVKKLDANYPPNIIAANGCNFNGIVNNSYASFKSPSTADGSGGADCRMIFRNFYNTDNTEYNREGSSTNVGVSPSKYSTAGKEGLNISQYECLEFDLKILSGAGYKKSRNEEPYNGFRVHFYYETNDATAHYLDYDGWNLDGYDQSANAFNFGGQLRFDSNGNYLDFGKWVTIRIPLTDAIRNPSTGRAPTVKQVTIRIVGAMDANKEIFQIDDLRFVKNDDHEGKVYKGFSGYTAQDYPSGEYFMINDFEFESDHTIDDYGGRNIHDSASTGDKTYNRADGTLRPFKGANALPEYERAIRYEEVNSNDKFHNFLPTDSANFNWGYRGTAIPSGDYNSYIAGPGIVTQGNYGLVLKNKDNNGANYGSNAGGWQLPIYYQRHYGTPMDLSKYTHFAIDIYCRQGYKRPSGSTAQGVTFSIQLFQQYTMTNGKMNNGTADHDDYNFLNGYTIKFFLPYGADCWESNLNTKDTSGGFGRIIPLSTYRGRGAANTTSYGGMRLIFTVEDILKGCQTYYKYSGVSGYPQNQIRGVGYGAYCLDKIDGMRFTWMNRTTDSDKRYDTYRDSGFGQINIMLDNFIAYRPDTSVTIRNETNSGDVALDANQQFVYNIYGGYTSTNSAYMNGQLGSLTPDVNITGKYDGTDDYFTKGQSHRVSVPANGSVTIRNLPFNSYYVAQENWSWRYLVDTVTCDKSDILKHSAAAGNIATILPRVSLDGSGTRHVSILDLMNQRNFTLTFKQKREQTLYLDSNGQAAVNNFN